MICVIELSEPNGICPVVWWGRTDDNRQIFIHYRSGNLAVGLGSTEDEAVGDDYYYETGLDLDPSTVTTDQIINLLQLKGVF